MTEHSGADDTVTVVPIAELRPADTPRLTGENEQHVRTLAALGEALPPIVVHRATMKVVDGMHRLRAAELRGDEEIAVRFFDDSPEMAFLHAVQANVSHGLPLSSAERQAAAARIVASHPQWSDRAVAAATGLCAATVAAVRRCSTEQPQQLNVRIGRDGRIRPVNSADGRRRAGTVLAERPDTPLREVARIAGISVGTAKDVRDRVLRGDDPVPDRFRSAVPAEPRPPAAGSAEAERARLAEALHTDPTLRFSQAGRLLLRLVSAHALGCAEWEGIVRAAPRHCLPAMARLARGYADTWQQLAAAFERRVGG
ncbi:ParB N-terminal domain-containing protein [Kutzneria buriramensis]|uniref:ParB-like chromosome segregation protein Spo0J n=1 Tax=Kutzneria buriramensis TaxID=1045776 RepID=A0A3E0H0X6_9PSEU|nr:ParB N-terminal domain-containing protein [Kutzneria buriramensis]REH35690.1 ParB-like chromosome segregation protein Spo0J [Kutzneria buriramensis]